MFGMGLPEVAVVVVVGLIVFGPDKLPGMAKQAGQLVRTLRQMAENAKNDLGRELGEDFTDLDLKSLDPREVVRRTMFDDEPARPARASSAQPVSQTPLSPRALRPGEVPPFDPEAT